MTVALSRVCFLPGLAMTSKVVVCSGVTVCAPILSTLLLLSSNALAFFDSHLTVTGSLSFAPTLCVR